MKKFFTIVLAASMLLIGSNTHAQTWTAAGGFTTFSLSGPDADKVMDGSMPGFYFGVSYDYAFSSLEGLTVEPGLYFMHYGKDRTMPFTTESKAYRANYFHIPVNLKYTIPFDANIRVSAFTGPRLNFFGMGNMFSKGVTFPSLKNLDVQWGLGVSATIVDAVMLRAGYDFGLTKCVKDNTKHESWANDLKVHRNSFYIGVGFAF
ncbi:MAG TPA: hypothetical protein DDX40_05185 [Rikenellaceae bacterium]|nr:hypothetical protein [Rikenellaceae bacterium]